MAASITSGYDRDCDAVGGVKTLYAWNTADLASSTVTAGELTAVSLDSGKYAYAFNVEIETATFTDTAVGDRANNSYGREQTATVVLHGNTKEMIVTIEALCKGRTTWAVELNDGTYEVLFLENGAKCNDERTPGTAYEDGNMNTLTLTGKEPSKAPKVDASLITALLEPTS